jgi:hypothetical protein
MKSCETTDKDLAIRKKTLIYFESNLGYTNQRTIKKKGLKSHYLADSAVRHRYNQPGNSGAPSFNSQFDSTKHRRFFPGIPVSSCSNTKSTRDNPYSPYWTPRENR